MTAQIIAIDSDEHREVQSLLPWLANGTLPAAELDRVRDHVARCERCGADAAWQEALRLAASAMPAAPADVERGWAAMRAQIAPREPRAAEPGWWARIGWPVLAGGQAAVALVLAVVLVLRNAPQEAQYRALGNAPTAAASANALVVFRAEATESQIREALRASQARIVDGPTVTDAYLLQLPSSSQAALARLRGNAAVTRVESLQGGSP